jgi:hypothetical protein
MGGGLLCQILPAKPQIKNPPIKVTAQRKNRILPTSTAVCADIRTIAHRARTHLGELDDFRREACERIDRFKANLQGSEYAAVREKFLDTLANMLAVTRPNSAPRESEILKAAIDRLGGSD